MARAFEWHSKGRGFNSPCLHQERTEMSVLGSWVKKVVRRVVVWLDTEPDEADLFGVHLRRTWQVFRRKGH